jgi:hypothetical protein
VGGIAEDAGGDLVASIVELIQAAYAPLSLKPDLRTAIRNDRMGFTVKVQNPNVLPLTITSLALILPRGLRYVRGTSSGVTRAEPAIAGRKLTWSFARGLAAGHQISEHLNVRVARRLGTYRAKASAAVQTAAGNDLVSKAAANLHVKRRISAIAFRFQTGPATTWTIAGRAAARLRAHTRLARAHGMLLARKRAGGSVMLRVMRLRLEKLVGPTRARLALRVVSSHGFARCRTGAAAVLRVLSSTDIRADGTTGTYLRLRLSRECGGTIVAPAAITVSDR